MRGITLITMFSVLFTSEAQNNGCGLYSCGSCCRRNLISIGPRLQSNFENQPSFVSFLPQSAEAELVDNICFTIFRLPNGIVQTIQSRVYSDGTNSVQSFITSQNSDGSYLNGSPQCTFVGINFNRVQDGCDVSLFYRCVVNGDCLTPRFEPVWGTTQTRRRLPERCWGPVQAAITAAGFQETRFVSLPMRLPPRCVFTQACTITPSPAVQRYQQALGFGDLVRSPQC